MADSSTRSGGSLFLLALVLLSAGLTFLLFHHTVGYGLDYDDYYFVRPYTLAEIAETFRGSWDDSGIMVPFYRPLTIVWYALRFELFGIDAAAHHIVSLTLFALAAVLAGIFLLLATGSRLVSAFVVIAFITHPAMPYAQVAWTTNQMHLLASLLVLAGLVWAQHVARRGLVWWLPLLPLAAAAFMVKEDCVVLLPAIVAVHMLRRWIVDRSVPAIPWTFVLFAALLVAGLVALRHEMLGGLGGYGRPGPEQAWHNYSLGLERVFRLVPVRRPFQWTASWFGTLLPLAALIVWPWAGRGPRFAIAAGLTLAVLFNAPFVFVTKNEQMHLVALGASVVFGGSAAALVNAARVRALQYAVTLVLLAGFAACAALSRHVSTDFAPFGPIVRSHDEIVLGWGVVPDELRDYIRRKNEPDAERTLSPNPKDELRVIGFGFHGYEPGGERPPQRWMAGSSARIYVDPGIGTIVLPVRHERGAFGEPTAVTITVNGRLADTMTLDDGVWRYSTVVLRGRPVPWLARMHEIRIEIPHAWVPAQVAPGSGDPRTLGLQIGEPSLR